MGFRIQEFLAFNQNALNNLIYLFTSNLWHVLFLVAVIGIIVLRIKDVLDSHVEEHIGII